MLLLYKTKQTQYVLLKNKSNKRKIYMLSRELEKTKTLEWYLEGYENELDRYDWGDSDEPKGRELI